MPTLEELAKHDNYAVIGPVGLYLRTIRLMDDDPVLWSTLNRVEVIGQSHLPAYHINLLSSELAGYEKGFIMSATKVKFERLKVKIASPPCLALDYMIRRGSLSCDFAEFVKHRGNLQPEVLRNMLKGLRKQDLFVDILWLLYDFSPRKYF